MEDLLFNLTCKAAKPIYDLIFLCTTLIMKIELETLQTNCKLSNLIECEMKKFKCFGTR